MDIASSLLSLPVSSVLDPVPNPQPRAPRFERGVRVGLAAALVVLCLGCAAEGPSGEAEPVATALPADASRPLDPPAEPGSFAPHLARGRDGGVLATWLEPVGEERHRVRFARLDGEQWSAASTIAEGDDFFANWADFPAVIDAADGSLFAHWLAKTGADTYAYSIFLARSADGGASWQPLGPLNDDDVATEHGFVSWVREGDGARAFWLDGRAMAAGEPMTLRTARVGAEGAEPSELLDPRVCECCTTGAAVTDAGPLVAFRDRGETEIRDVAVVTRAGEEGWSEPRIPAADGWRIEGCPVNGPALGAAGGRVAMSWFTAAEGVPAVRAAFSDDGGTTWGEPIEVDGEAPFGRVDTVIADGGAWVTWLAPEGEQAAVRLRWVGDDGTLGETHTVAETSASRASGFPRLVRDGDRLVAAWVQIEGEGPSRVRVATLPAGDR